jgi:hypothetical protein
VARAAAAAQAAWGAWREARPGWHGRGRLDRLPISAGARLADALVSDDAFLALRRVRPSGALRRARGVCCVNRHPQRALQLTLN